MTDPTANFTTHCSDCEYSYTSTPIVCGCSCSKCRSCWPANPQVIEYFDVPPIPNETIEAVCAWLDSNRWRDVLKDTGRTSLRGDMRSNMPCSCSGEQSEPDCPRHGEPSFIASLDNEHLSIGVPTPAIEHAPAGFNHQIIGIDPGVTGVYYYPYEGSLPCIEHVPSEDDIEYARRIGASIRVRPVLAQAADQIHEYDMPDHTKPQPSASPSPSKGTPVPETPKRDAPNTSSQPNTTNPKVADIGTHEGSSNAKAEPSK